MVNSWMSDNAFLHILSVCEGDSIELANILASMQSIPGRTREEICRQFDLSVESFSDLLSLRQLIPGLQTLLSLEHLTLDEAYKLARQTEEDQQRNYRIFLRRARHKLRQARKDEIRRQPGQ